MYVTDVEVSDYLPSKGIGVAVQVSLTGNVMNILFFGSDQLLARVHQQAKEQSWDIHRAEDPDHVLDYKGTHSFQAAIFGLCEDSSSVRAATLNAKNSCLSSCS